MLTCVSVASRQLEDIEQSKACRNKNSGCLHPHACLILLYWSRSQNKNVGPGCCEVIQSQASCTASTRQTCKRNIDNVDGVNAEKDADKENISLSCALAAIKCICRERTGTDWQLVLDVIEYDEERCRQSRLEGMVAQTVTPVMEENYYEKTQIHTSSTSTWLSLVSPRQI